MSKLALFLLVLVIMIGTLEQEQLCIDLKTMIDTYCYQSEDQIPEYGPGPPDNPYNPGTINSPLPIYPDYPSHYPKKQRKIK